jgi:hypothetical protein
LPAEFFFAELLPKSAVKMDIKTADVETKQLDSGSDSNIDGAETQKKSLKIRILEVIWDGERSPEERKLVQRLDLFLMYVLIGFIMKIVADL